MNEIRILGVRNLKRKRKSPLQSAFELRFQIHGMTGRGLSKSSLRYVSLKITAIQMQSYNKNIDIKKIRTISGFQWANIVLNQESIGSKLKLSRNIVKHIPMFLEMLDFQRKHKKWDYVYLKIGEKYHLSPSTVKRVRFSMLREVHV